MPLHLIKLCVGCDTVDELLAWRRNAFAEDQPWILRTRQTPRRADELTAGGSLYRVYKGTILSRQRILHIETIGVGPARHCELLLDQEVVLTVPFPRRAFQGWRYLEPNDAPADLASAAALGSLPIEFARRLRDIGVL